MSISQLESKIKELESELAKEVAELNAEVERRKGKYLGKYFKYSEDSWYRVTEIKGYHINGIYLDKDTIREAIDISESRLKEEAPKEEFNKKFAETITRLVKQLD